LNQTLKLDAVMAGLPRAYPGPGGAAAVLRDGEVLVRHAWGWANAERRIPFTPKTLFRLCSMTKQFTCGLLLDLVPDPTILDGAVRAYLPKLADPPSIIALCHNQSGLRDYWALGTLHGAVAGSEFSEKDAATVTSGIQTLQFKPGTQYSYANQNFRILCNILQDATGQSFENLLKDRLFSVVGMRDARLTADTCAMPGETQGYEGDEHSGFRPADNAIVWTGDGGIGATLDDMIAWEQYIDYNRERPDALYSKLSAPVSFADGSSAGYGFGLNHRAELGRAASGHSGTLRGWRSHRFYLPDERVSVVVMFNHMADAHSAAIDLLAAALNQDRQTASVSLAAPDWLGFYEDADTGLAVRIDALKDGRIRVRYGQSAQILSLRTEDMAAGEHTRLRAVGGGIWMDRLRENKSFFLRKSQRGPRLDVAGRYVCKELDTELSVVEQGRVLYAAFSGFLGQGRMEALDPISHDAWTLPCPRALDFAPPGDWALQFQRDENGRPLRVDVGCWRARGLSYDRVS
jgi:D-aminopeptidase